MWISRDAIGWHDIPGLFTDEQIAHWKQVTDAVHRSGGVIFAQLWHTGSPSYPDFFDGRPPLAPSAVNPRPLAPTSGRKATVEPLAMSEHDTRQTVADFATAARNAMRAGFDGVQLQVGFNYLISQFLNPRTNVRTDRYGGSIENRARFLFEIIEAIGVHVDLRRVGVKARPAWAETGAFVAGSESLADDLADLVAYGQAFITNPDLPDRFADHAPLNEPKPDLFYGRDAADYADFPQRERERTRGLPRGGDGSHWEETGEPTAEAGRRHDSAW
ncbi:hypothetical protein [Streptomyces sp. NPDC058086]|uniref:oxidoreductase n=1 Tax=Streptomyces sp. NPDC058086 TaxID=3346334 RepID=UPI0036E889A8